MRRVILVFAVIALGGCGGGAQPQETTPPSAPPATSAAAVDCVSDVPDSPGLLSVQQAVGTSPPAERSARVVALDPVGCRPRSVPATLDVCRSDWQPAADPDALAASGIGRLGEATFTRAGTTMIRQLRLDAMSGRAEDVTRTVRGALTSCGADVIAVVNDQPELYRLASGDSVVRVTQGRVDILHRLDASAQEPATVLDAVAALP